MTTTRLTHVGAAQTAIPAEIREFLATPGNVLLVKGSAGAGKTTLALEALQLPHDRARAVYLATRTDEVAMTRHFPWLDEVGLVDAVEATRALRIETGAAIRPLRDAGAAYDERRSGNGDAEDVTRLRLRRLLGGELAVRLPAESVERFALADLALGEDALVVLDSLEGLSASFHRSAADLFVDLRDIVVGDYGANLVVVLESDGPSAIDYLADGIITLRQERLDASIVRVLRLEKMRGVNIANSTYLYTLHGGRFRAFGPDRGDRLPPRPPADAAPGDRLSTGMPRLDAALGGGYAWGATVLMEADPPVNDGLLDGLVLGPLTSALHAGHVVHLETSLGQDAAALRRELARHVPAEAVSSRLVVAPEADAASGAPARALVGGPASRADDLALHANEVAATVARAANEGRRPVVVLSWDRVAARHEDRDRDALLADAAHRARAAGGILLVFRRGTPDERNDLLRNVANVHLRIDAIEKVPIVVLDRPYRGAFGLGEADGSMDAVPYE